MNATTTYTPMVKIVLGSPSLRNLARDFEMSSTVQERILGVYRLHSEDHSVTQIGGLNAGLYSQWKVVIPH
jgi:hypothetical protein